MSLIQSFKSNTAKGIISFGLAFLLIFVPEYYQHREAGKHAEQVKRAESNLKTFSEKLQSTLTKIAELKNEKEFHAAILHGGYEAVGMSFFVLTHGTVMLWSSNEPAVNSLFLDTVRSAPRINLPNGDYAVEVLKRDSVTYIGLLLIRKNYPYENRYLVNEFNQALIDCPVTTGHAGIPFLLIDGSVGYHITFLEQVSNTFLVMYWMALLIGLFGFYFLIKGRSFMLTVFSILIIAAIRILMIYLKMPDELYNLILFSPQYYGSSFLFNSPGDLLINCAILFVSAILLYENSIGKSITMTGKIVWVSGWIFAAVGLHFFLQGLVVNSKISFDVSHPASIDMYSLLAFSAVGTLLISFLFFTAAGLQLFGKKKLMRRYGIALVLMAAYASVTLAMANQKKEMESRKLVAQKVDSRQDHVAEYFFEEAKIKMYADAKIKALINSKPVNQEAISNYIIRKYLSGYLSKFDFSLVVFDSSGGNTSDKSFLQNFNQQISKGKLTYCDKLYFISNETGGLSYLALLPFDDAGSKQLAITMTTRFFQSEEGFPELFISSRYQENFSTGDYSIARYRNNNLVYEFGNYVYSLTPKEFQIGEGEYQFVSSGGYDHLLYKLSPTSLIVVSKPSEGILNLLALFSWIFTVMLVIRFLIFVFSYLTQSTAELNWNLTSRIQRSVLFLVVFSFLLIGIGTTFYINRKYENDQKKSISDQVNALWFRVSEIGLMPDLITQEQINQLDRLAANTNINFNLFNQNGGLFYSSQTKIYENGIIGPLMNPEAFFEIKGKGITQYILPENAGKLNYIAAYAPVIDRTGKLSAFLNLPYFEKQNELNKEISGFLSALLNIYVLLFALAVLITILISAQITKPLLLIQEKMSGLKFGSANEQIEYAANDEIGQLVKEYNRMLEQLAISADKLAQSERESAWREMAKQVAHEIKNPLTPMKLSIQHLQRTYKEKGPPEPEVISRIAENLIQQIDTLANIATAFSDFAKLPSTVAQEVDVSEIVDQLIDLYSEMPGIQIAVESTTNDTTISADKDQVIRIFTNIMNNAVQAIPPERDGRLTIRLSDDGAFLRVEIEDNGVGIPEDQLEKIFKPNFTTKSGGMGLGLAMVRNMINSLNGNIWFTSVYGQGSSFFLQLHKMV